MSDEGIINQYLKVVSKYTLILDNERFLNYKDTIELKYISSLGKEEVIPVGFIASLLKENELYEYFEKMIDNGNPSLRFSYITHGDIGTSIRINIVDALNILKQRNLSEQEKRRLDRLLNKSSVENLVKNSKNDYFTIKVEGDEITLSSYQILNLFFLNKKEFKELFDNDLILGIKKEKFAYILEKFLTEKNIFERYMVPLKYYQRFLSLKAQQLIDYEFINLYEKQELIRYDVELNKKLKTLILKDMDPKYSDLEKAIYIYIKLCKCFSYDPIFYASNQNGKIARYHEDIKRLEKITGKDDLIVCYEFNTIYAKFLEDLGIEHRINIKMGQNYGRNHANLDFKVDGFIIFADSVTSIIGSDLVNAKLDMPLNGLKCLNKSEKTQKKFDKILEKIYDEVSLQESKNKKDDSYVFNLLDLYRVFSSNERVDFTKKVGLMLEEIKNTKFKTMDALGYLSRLKKMIFNKVELSQNVSFVFVQNNIGKESVPIVVITINEKGNMYNADDNKYYCYSPHGTMNEFTKEEIESLFRQKDFQYLEKTKSKIPNINIENNSRGDKNDSRTKK